jgi:hypothetical protein
MRAFRLAVPVMAIVFAIGSWVSVGTGQQPTPGGLPGSPLGGRGEAIYPAFEGWGPLTDGQNALQIGYFNRNKEQVIDVPIGPNNRIEPGGPDMLQPTHFESGRHYGVFTIPVSKDFGNKKITWTLVANGQTSVVQFSLSQPYWIDFYKNAAKGNTPPVIKFAPDGPEYSGPPAGVALTMTATVGQPLKLTLWAKDRPNTYDPEEGLPPEARTARGRGADGAAGAAARGRGGRGDAQNFDLTAAAGRAGVGGGRGAGRGAGSQADVTVTWKLHRGAAPVKIADEAIRLFNQGNIDAVMEATTTATFSTAGEYMLRAQVNDQSGDGGGGEQCCWTNALVKVAVK